jgi:predicted  nucleic acid-binding Zn-ribbon protein
MLTLSREQIKQNNMLLLIVNLQNEIKELQKEIEDLRNKLSQEESLNYNYRSTKEDPEITL